MNENEQRQQNHVPLGSVELHAPLLTVPPDGQLLYKIMSAENLIRSIINNYLHFSRVDSYPDFPGADPHDGRQLPKDQLGNESKKFEEAPNYSVKNYYDGSRGRTYACCFSLKNSDYIWKNYANGSEKGKVCLVFEFGKLRATLNRTLQSENVALEYNGKRCHQIFDVNYGNIKYVEWDNYHINTERDSNPIIYTYLKDNRFSKEKEFRISLSTIGMGQFALNDGSAIQFLPNLQLAFDFRAAIAGKTIRQILYAPDSDSDFLQAEFHKLGILPIKA